MRSCTSPISREKLLALCAGEIGDEDAGRLEEHLFACDECGATWERLERLAAGLREMLPPVVSRARRDRLAAEGLRLRETRVQAGVDARAVFSRDVDLLVHVLYGDLARAERVDMEIIGLDGVPYLILEHIPFDRAAGEVLIACQRHFQQMPPGTFRLYAVEGGTRRVVGDYYVEHIWE